MKLILAFRPNCLTMKGQALMLTTAHKLMVAEFEQQYGREKPYYEFCTEKPYKRLRRHGFTACCRES